MITSSILFKNYITELESSIILTIERELDILFSSCKKSAKVYSCMISNNLALHDKKTFEELVLSPQEINTLIENVMSKFTEELNKSIKYPHSNALLTTSIENDYYNHFLKDTTKVFKITQVTTKICEKIINSSISRILDCTCTNKLVKNSLKKATSSKKILDKHNFENQRKKHQELIYKQIEGFLVNTEVSLRNELIKTCITYISSITYMYESFSIA